MKLQIDRFYYSRNERTVHIVNHNGPLFYGYFTDEPEYQEYWQEDGLWSPYTRDPQDGWDLLTELEPDKPIETPSILEVL